MNFQNPANCKETLDSKKLYIFDMDGTIYLGYQVFPYAIRFINNLRAAGKKVLFFTNNASHTTEFYVQKLTKLGFSPTPDEIMTSGDVTIEFLKRHRPGKTVYLVGTDELVENFRQSGIPMLSGKEEQADIVIKQPVEGDLPPLRGKTVDAKLSADDGIQTGAIQTSVMYDGTFRDILPQGVPLQQLLLRGSQLIPKWEIRGNFHNPASFSL